MKSFEQIIKEAVNITAEQIENIEKSDPHISELLYGSHGLCHEIEAGDDYDEDELMKYLPKDFVVLNDYDDYSQDQLDAIDIARLKNWYDWIEDTAQENAIIILFNMYWTKDILLKAL